MCLHRADRRRLDPRLRPDLLIGSRGARARAAPVATSTGASTPGAASTRPVADDVGAAGARAAPRDAALRARARARGRLDRGERRRHVLTTEQCLLNPNRNPRSAGPDRAGARATTSASRTCSGSATASRATTPTGTSTTSRASSRRGRSSTAVEDDPSDRRTSRRSQDNLRRLRARARRAGRPLEIVTLPMPGPVLADGEPLPASYANFYIANGVVLVPTYDHPNDAPRDRDPPAPLPDPHRRAHRLRAAGLGHGRHPLRHPAAAPGLGE